MKKSHYFLLLCMLAGCCIPMQGKKTKADNDRPRVVIMTDAETDDRCSMVHALLYANDMDIAAIIQTNSCFQKHGWSREPWLEQMIDAYGKVFPNLKVHDPNYPTPEDLHSVCYVGDEDPTHIPNIGKAYKALYTGEPVVINPAEWKDTPGSDRIVELLLDDDPRQLIIQCWGGGNTAAKAFEKLKRKYPEKYETAIRKAVLYCIWYQDAAGPYIEKEHPGATILLNHHFSGSWDYGTMTNTESFVKDYLQNGQNPLGAFYSQPYISEGDTPAFLYCLGGKGLRSWHHPSFGGWGGRFYRVKGTENVWRDTGYGEIREWMEPALHDFQARLQWCITPEYSKANHAPEIVLTMSPDIAVESGEEVHLSAKVSDADSIDLESVWKLRGVMWEQKGRTKEKFLENPQRFIERWRTGWSQMPSGSYHGYVDLKFDEKKATCSFIAPDVEEPQTIHILLEAFDMAIPRLTSHQRYIITVTPKKK